MRHLIGVVLAIVLAAAVFFVASWGYLKLLTANLYQENLTGPGRFGTLPPAGSGSLLHDRIVVEGFGALLAVGLVAGILIAVPRVSPLASGLPGLVLLGWTGLYLFSVRHAVRYIPLKTRVYGSGFEDMLFDGVLALVGMAMIIPLFVPSRWRRRVPAAYQGAGYPDSQPTYSASQPNYAASQPAYPDSQPTFPTSQPTFPTSQPVFPDSQPTQSLADDSTLTSSDWSATATRPQQRIDPNVQGQAPWGPAEYS
jgi:hypothetical protein